MVYCNRLKSQSWLHVKGWLICGDSFQFHESVCHLARSHHCHDTCATCTICSYFAINEQRAVLFGFLSILWHRSWYHDLHHDSEAQIRQAHKEIFTCTCRQKWNSEGGQQVLISSEPFQLPRTSRFDFVGRTHPRM